MPLLELCIQREDRAKEEACTRNPLPYDVTAQAQNATLFCSDAPLRGVSKARILLYQTESDRWEECRLISVELMFFAAAPLKFRESAIFTVRFIPRFRVWSICAAQADQAEEVTRPLIPFMCTKA